MKMTRLIIMIVMRMLMMRLEDERVCVYDDAKTGCSIFYIRY